jgi:thymidylate synthase (FAD)
MILVKPSINKIWSTPNPQVVVEKIARTCYKSEDKICPGSAEKMILMLIDRGHTAMLEHASASYRIVCDRGVTHELVRHRIASYAQESTRYCNYKGGVTYVIPPWLCVREGERTEIAYATDSIAPETVWLNTMLAAETSYKVLIESGQTPQQARGVLPNSLKTEICATMNMREWRHFFLLRRSKKAHPQMREIADMVYVHMMRTELAVFLADCWKQ